MNYYNYFSEIEGAFIKRRGKHMMLSPLDWSLMESWKEQGVPLGVAIRGINSVFDSIERGERKVDVKSLSYCRDEVEKLFEQWKKNQVGKNRNSASTTESAIDSAGEKIVSLISKLKSARSELDANIGSGQFELIDGVIADLESVDLAKTDVDQLEPVFEDMDGRVDEFVLGTVDQGTLAAHRKSVRDEMSSYKGKLSDDEFTNTIERMLKRSLREHFGLPRITLLDL